jgi:hypothetical protein
MRSLLLGFPRVNRLTNLIALDEARGTKHNLHTGPSKPETKEKAPGEEIS